MYKGGVLSRLIERWRNERVAMIAGVAILVALFAYYCIGAAMLPLNAGPDETDTRNAARFYIEHKRLAVFPNDEANVAWSSYGTTRTMRPPFPYLAAIISGKLTGFQPTVEHALRYGSSIAIALMLGAAWLAALVMGARAVSANVALVFIGLWPQVAFTAMYFNDDAAAWMVCGFAALAMAVLLRDGLSASALIACAFVGGLFAVNKQSGAPWALLLCVVLIHALRHQFYEVRRWSVWGYALLAFVIGGGWWVLFNMYHYGIDDPLQMKVMAQTALEKSTIKNVDAKGLWHRESMTMFDTWRFRFFWNHTYVNTIGNVGWLYAPVGTLYYLVYGACLSALALWSVWRVIAFNGAQSMISLIALVGLGLSLTLYVWFNTYSDVQIQGRYILPSIAFVLVVAALAIDMALNKLRSGHRAWSGVYAITLLVGLHAFASYHYVYPIFWQDRQMLKWSAEYRTDLTDPFWVERVEDLRIERTDKGWLLIRTGPDPKIFYNPGVCFYFGRNFQVLANIEASQPDLFKVYYDLGYGFTESQSSATRYGKNHVTVSVFEAVPMCRQIRIDPFEKNDQVLIRDYVVRPLIIRSR